MNPNNNIGKRQYQNSQEYQIKQQRLRTRQEQADWANEHEKAAEEEDRLQRLQNFAFEQRFHDDDFEEKFQDLQRLNEYEQDIIESMEQKQIKELEEMERLEIEQLNDNNNSIESIKLNKKSFEDEEEEEHDMMEMEDYPWKQWEYQEQLQELEKIVADQWFDHCPRKSSQQHESTSSTNMIEREIIFSKSSIDVENAMIRLNDDDDDSEDLTMETEYEINNNNQK